MYDDLDLTDKDFGLWHVKNKSKKRNGAQMYTCVCRCGTIKDVSVYNLVNGRTTSCGAAEEKLFGDFLEWYAKEYPNQFVKMQKKKESEEYTKAADASAAFRGK